MSWALRDYCFPDVFFLPASSQLLIILLEIQPCVVSSNQRCVLAINGFNQRSSIFQHPFHLNKKKLHHKVSSWWIKKQTKSWICFNNYKNVIAYVKYTDVICLYQGTNIYEFLVEKLKPSSTFYQYKRCLFLSRRVFFEGFPQGLAFKMGRVQ